MRRALLAASLLGCSAAPPAPVAVAPPPTPPPIATAAVAAPVETPDDTFRYRPPSIEATAPWAPPPVAELRWPSGVRALLVEQHHLPLASVRVSLRRDERAPIPGLDAILVDLLADAPAADGGPSLREALRSLGAQARFDLTRDALVVEVSAAAPVLGAAITATTAGVLHLAPRQDALDRARKTRVKDLEAPGATRSTESTRARLMRAVNEQLLPPGHRYQEPTPTAADFERIKLADVSRWYARLARPERLRLAVTGDLTAEALRATVGAALAEWKQPAPPPAKREALKLARGVFLVEEESARVELAVVLPAAPLTDPSGLLGPALNRALGRSVNDWMRKEVKGAWSNADINSGDRRDLPLVFIGVALQPEDVAEVVRGILDAMSRVAQGELADEDIAGSRRDNLRYLEGLHTTDTELTRWLGWHTDLEVPADTMRRLYDARLHAGRAEVLAAARAVFKRDEARVVVVGAAAGARDALAKLGLGPVTVVRAKKDAGAKKKDAAKGAKAP